MREKGDFSVAYNIGGETAAGTSVYGENIM